MNNAMQEAFARVGINGYAARQVGPRIPLNAPRAQAAPRPPADPSIPPENHGISTTRDRVLEATAAIEAMSDRELDVEIIALGENADAIKVELRGVIVQPELHPIGWQRRAERALVGIKARLLICAKEQERRRRAAAEQAQTSKAARYAEHERTVAIYRERAEARRSAHDAKEAAEALAFVRAARRVLPHETLLAIWQTVNAATEGQP
jgi:hypothetical protein